MNGHHVEAHERQNPDGDGDGKAFESQETSGFEAGEEDCFVVSCHFGGFESLGGLMSALEAATRLNGNGPSLLLCVLVNGVERISHILRISKSLPQVDPITISALVWAAFVILFSDMSFIQFHGKRASALG
jgi:hypothetical protein